MSAHKCRNKFNRIPFRKEFHCFKLLKLCLQIESIAALRLSGGYPIAKHLNKDILCLLRKFIQICFPRSPYR